MRQLYITNLIIRNNSYTQTTANSYYPLIFLIHQGFWGKYIKCNLLQVYEYLSVTVMNRTQFKSKANGLMIAYRYKMTKKIPKQLDSSSSSKYLDNFSVYVQIAINVIASSSALIQFVFAFAMSRLWGMIKSIQIILMFPLTLVDIPANVQLLYFFMTYNFNMELVPLDDLSFQFMDFESSSYPAKTPFNDKFEDQGFASLYFLENGASNVSNINVALIFCLSIVAVVKLLERYKRNYRITDFLYEFLIFNYLVDIMLEYSLQFLIFAFANIYQYDKLESTGQFYSYIVACLYVVAYIGLMKLIANLVNNAYLTKNNVKKATIDLAKKYPRVEAIFSLYRNESREAQLYNAVFLLRRFFLAATIVFVNDHFFQIVLLVFNSLASLAYMIQVRPFENPALNKLETFNELIILICCYHLLLFSEANSDIKLKYLTGWSMDMLIIMQFILNIITYMWGTMYRVRMVLRRLIIKAQMRRIQKGIQESKKKLDTTQDKVEDPSTGGINTDQPLVFDHLAYNFDRQAANGPQQINPLNLMRKAQKPFTLQLHATNMIKKQNLPQQLDDVGFAYRFNEIQETFKMNNQVDNELGQNQDVEEEFSESIEGELSMISQQQSQYNDVIFNQPLPHQVEDALVMTRHNSNISQIAQLSMLQERN